MQYGLPGRSDWNGTNLLRWGNRAAAGKQVGVIPS
jgi:hypothetical protein